MRLDIRMGLEDGIEMNLIYRMHRHYGHFVNGNYEMNWNRSDFQAWRLEVYVAAMSFEEFCALVQQ